MKSSRCPGIHCPGCGHGTGNGIARLIAGGSVVALAVVVIRSGPAIGRAANDAVSVALITALTVGGLLVLVLVIAIIVRASRRPASSRATLRAVVEPEIRAGARREIPARSIRVLPPGYVIPSDRQEMPR